MKPTRQPDVLNRRDWKYTPAAHTDLAKTFKRVREQQKALQAEQFEKVIKMKVSK